jgi:hypothetical protein
VTDWPRLVRGDLHHIDHFEACLCHHTSLVSQASQAGYPDMEPSWWTPPFLITVEVVDSVNVGGWIA